MPLSRDQIVQTAIELLDQEGLEKLSMRRLGDALGVKAMSLYNHVRNKSDLLNAVHEQLLSELQVAAPTENWKEGVRATAHSFLDLLRAHPAAIPLFATRSAIAPGSLKVLEASLKLLMGSGFTPREALMTFQSLFTFVVGHALFHYGRTDPDSYSAGAGYENFPALAQFADLSSYTPAQEFEFALERFLVGLNELLKR